MALDAKTSRRWYNLGLDYANAEDFEPDHAGHWYNLGLVQAKLNDKKKAAASFHKAAALEPNRKDIAEMLEWAEPTDSE